MAERPIFLPAPETAGFVSSKKVVFQWHAGFALSQKQRNISSLHESAKALNIYPILEVSTKSKDPLGVNLSAFNLRMSINGVGLASVESSFQGSKVFHLGGPYTDLYHASPIEAKRDMRLKNSGSLKYFKFQNTRWKLNPPTAFYNWLYLRALFQSQIQIEDLAKFEGFSDIEFNPKKSLNCQACACAFLVGLYRGGCFSSDLLSQNSFLKKVGKSLDLSTGEGSAQTEFEF